MSRDKKGGRDKDGRDKDWKDKDWKDKDWKDWDKKFDFKGQHQGQHQGQAQHQHQDQFAMQGVKQKAESYNKNKNENKNENKNKNENHNENKNKVENKLENKVDNKVENKIDNDIDVDVKVDLDLDGWKPEDNDVLDIDHIMFKDDLDGAFTAVANNVYQDVSGKGNDGAFNVQQINNMVDNDKAYDFNIKDNDFDGDVKAKAYGGDAKVDDVKAEIDESGVIQNVGNASADAALDQNVFSQNITQGANIQFNESAISHVGKDMEDSVLM